MGDIKLVCFDLGGVLIRICRSWGEACVKAGLDLRGEFANGHAAITKSDGWRALAKDFDTGRIDCRTWAMGVSRLLDGLYDANEIQRAHDAVLVDEYEGVANVIDRIHQDGLETSCLSNTNATHWLRIPEYPAVMKLDYRLASHMLGHRKPDAEIFAAAERHWGLQGDQIIFFDDMQENIEAARSRGWRAHFIDPHSRTDIQIEHALEDILS